MSDRVDDFEDALDDRFRAVSSAAFRRHGEVLTTRESTIQFEITVARTGTDQERVTRPPAKCEVSESNEPLSLKKAILRDPLSDDSTHAVTRETTHERKDCHRCQGIGELQCDRCNGNGRTSCDTCEATGIADVPVECSECGGTGSVGEIECSACAGKGKVKTERRCPDCEGNLHTSCGGCGGNGVVRCSTCVGTGRIHQYDRTVFHVTRSVDLIEAPSQWAGDVDDLAAEFDIRRKDVGTYETTPRQVDIRTEPIACTFAVLEYGGTEHRLLYQIDHGSVSYIWDPETGYPKTSRLKAIYNFFTQLI